PALVLAKQAEKIFAGLPRRGLVVRGIYGEGSQAQGNIFQISNQITLGRDEKEIIEILQDFVLQIIDAERKARKLLREQYSIPLEDNIWRAYGILRHSRSLSSQEMMERLSQLRLGMDLGLFPDLSGKMINEMMIRGQSAFLEENCGKNLTSTLRDWERASMIRHYLASIGEVKDND
ncbi:MAG: ATP--guanido phosphotransferase, partial [Clostridiales bacterium]